MLFDGDELASIKWSWRMALDELTSDRIKGDDNAYSC